MERIRKEAYFSEERLGPGTQHCINWASWQEHFIVWLELFRALRTFFQFLREKVSALWDFLILVLSNLCPRSVNLQNLGLWKDVNPSTNLETRKKCHLEPGLKTPGLPQSPRIRRTAIQVNLQRNIIAKQIRDTAEEPVQVVSTEQGLEVEVGLLCYADQVMADVIPMFVLVIMYREIRNAHPVALEVKVCIVRVDWGERVLPWFASKVGQLGLSFLKKMNSWRV